MILAGIGSAVAVLLLYVLFLWINTLFIGKDKLYDEKSPYYTSLTNGLDRVILFLSRVHITTEGLDKVPKDQMFLLVSNHLSGYDPLATMRVLQDRDMIFVMKPEIMKIPIAGALARRCCFRPIDRENARNALVTVKDCARLLSNRVGPVAIYPEGTRSKNGELLPFHNSVFKIAQDANVPVVVMTVSGTEAITGNMPWRRTDVHLRFLDVISAEHVKESRTSQIGEEVRQLILNSRQEDGTDGN